MRFRGHLHFEDKALQEGGRSPRRQQPRQQQQHYFPLQNSWWSSTTIPQSLFSVKAEDSSNVLVRRPEIVEGEADIESGPKNIYIMTSLNTPADNAHEQMPSVIPKFAFRELTLGKLVGQGGFSDVRDILSIDLEEVFDTSEEEAKLRRQFANTVNYKGSEPKKFVLKTIRNDLPEDEHMKGVFDLATEANILASLHHESIISLRAIANSDPHHNRFFVVLDRLGVTLERKFRIWRKIAGDSTGIYIPCYGHCCSKVAALHDLWKERLEVSLHTAQAIEYLHNHGIVYRDLKPDNIGFDAETNMVKLFDFGLAKRWREAEKAPDNGQHPSFSGLYQLTGNTGSLRYMAPEVAKCLPYDHTVDAYSFGILFWQICSLTTPYANYSTKMHADLVVRQGHRPKPDSTWPPTWIHLQKACWSTDKSVRPPFSQIVGILREQVQMLEGEDGFVPSRASEIRAKKRKNRVVSQSLDMDTRNTEAITAADGHAEEQKRLDTQVV